MALSFDDFKLHYAFMKLSVKISKSGKYLPEKLQLYSTEKNL